MRGEYGVQDFLQAARKRRLEVARELEELAREEARWRQRRTQAHADAVAARDDLAAAIVPDFTPASFQRAAQLTGFRKLVDEDPIAKREAERKGFREWMVKIEAEPRFRDRVKLRDPRVGQLTRKIAELEDFRAPFAEVLAKCAHPRIQRLIDVWYGTEKYDVPVWRLSYYADWKAGDEILEKWPDGTTFEDVRQQWLEASSTVAGYDERLATLRAEVKAGEELEQRWVAAKESLATLDARSLKGARDLVGQHVEQTGVATIAAMLAADPHVELLAKKCDGLTHRVKYLDELAEKQLFVLKRDLEDEARKLDRDVVKYSRPKKAWERFPGDKFERRFFGRDERFRKRYDRYRSGHESVWGYQDWHRPSLVEDFLWWDLMTDGRIDGDFIPEVEEWHRDRPHYTYQRQRDWERASETVARDRSTESAGMDVS